jgi:hypothetical protein
LRQKYGWHIICPMREFLIAAAILCVLVVAALLFLVKWESLFIVGIVMIAAGIVVGVPAGLVYHVQLYRTMRDKNKIAKGWVWRPFDYHKHLDRRDRRRVMPWAIVGGAGFFIIVIGQALLSAALINMYTAR